MAIRTRKGSLEEAPIKHTAGGEMPNPSEQHQVSAEEFEEIGEVEGTKRGAVFEKVRDYFPHALGAVGLGFGIFFLVRRLRERNLKEETDQAKSEAKRALDIDDVPPSRLMGA